MVRSQTLHRPLKRLPPFPEELHRHGPAKADLNRAQQGFLRNPVERLFRGRLTDPVADSALFF